MCSWSLIVLSRDTYERELMAILTTSHVWNVEWSVGSPTVSHLVYPYLNLSSPQVTWSHPPPPPQHSCNLWHLHPHPTMGATTIHGHASYDCIKKLLELISGHYSHHAMPWVWPCSCFLSPPRQGLNTCILSPILFYGRRGPDLCVLARESCIL